MYSKAITRRELLKTLGFAAATAALAKFFPGHAATGLTPAVECILTTCGGCPAGCSLVVYKASEKIVHIENNTAHPAIWVASCSGKQIALRDLYRPDRLRGPCLQVRGSNASRQSISWQTAILVVSEALSRYRPSQIAFLFGLFPDHLHDLAVRYLDGVNILRYAARPSQRAQVILMDAAHKHFGAPKVPVFDLGRARVIFSFGADSSETPSQKQLAPPAWLFPTDTSSVDHWDVRSIFKDSYQVRFSSPPLHGQHGADEWLTIRPGSEVILAQAFMTYIASTFASHNPVETTSVATLEEASLASGLSTQELERLARLFMNSPRPLAVPMEECLEGPSGLAAAQAILALNVAAGNLGKPGGVFLPLDSAIYPENNRRPAADAEIGALVERIAARQIKVLFVHGVDPLRDLPPAYEFASAIRTLDLLVSFSPFLDESARRADYILPDHTPFEAWGYQFAAGGRAHRALSALQPVIAPLYDTRATADVLLQAACIAKVSPLNEMDFSGETVFLQDSLATLINQGGAYTAPDPASFWQSWLEHGGWWTEKALLMPPVSLFSLDGRRPHPL
jgi:anaerobic selenocysteine-containing dehydrogenase